MFYLTMIQHNKEAGKTNRTIPTECDSLFDAKQAFHAQLGKDMSNSILDWSVVIVFDEMGNMILHERWDRPAQEEAAE